jgi:hypothetical protein
MTAIPQEKPGNGTHQLRMKHCTQHTSLPSFPCFLYNLPPSTCLTLQTQPPTPTALCPLSHQHLLSYKFSFPQIPHFRTTCTPIPHFLTIYPSGSPTRVLALLHFVLAVEVGACYIEAMNVPGDYPCDKKQTIDYCICSYSGNLGIVSGLGAKGWVEDIQALLRSWIERMFPEILTEEINEHYHQSFHHLNRFI